MSAVGSPMPPVTLHLKIENLSGETLSVEVVDFDSDLGNFAVHPSMLALAPSQVAMDAARDFVSTSRQRAADYPILGTGRRAQLGWAMEDYNPQGAAGNAAAASAEKGRALVEASARALADLLAEVSRLPLSTAYTGPLPS